MRRQYMWSCGKYAIKGSTFLTLEKLDVYKPGNEKMHESFGVFMDLNTYVVINSQNGKRFSLLFCNRCILSNLVNSARYL